MRKGGDLVTYEELVRVASVMGRAGKVAATAGKSLQRAVAKMAEVSTFDNSMTEDEIKAFYIKWQKSKKTGGSIQIRLKCEVEEGRLLRMMDI